MYVPATRKAKQMAEILLYGVVGDYWDGLDAASLVPQITSGSDDLIIAINSPGGLVIEGLAIFNAIERAKANGRKVICRIDGLAASMASVIALAGNEVVMAENALMMIHNPWDCACGDAEELRAAADRLDTLKATIVNIYAKRSGMSVDDVSALMDAETWMTAADAKAQGFIDTIGTAGTASACNITRFGFRKAPENPLIAQGAMASLNRTVSPVLAKGQTSMPENTQTGAGAPAVPAANNVVATPPVTPQPANPASSIIALSAADVQAAIVAERTRSTQIRALGNRHGMTAEFIDGLIDNGTTVSAAGDQILTQLATRQEAQGVGGPTMAITRDGRDKWMEGAVNWLIIRSGQQNTIEAAARKRGETIRLDAGEFRGINMVDLARESLVNAGARNISRNPMDMLGAAFTARNEINQGSGDFAVLLENVMHKVLQAAYAITPDTWSQFCGIGTLTDFRPHNRYLRGSFGALDSLNELGEFKNKAIPDGEKQSIIGGTKGNIISLSRQAIINDDLGIFTGLAHDLGRAAKLTIEIDVYALLASNPTMADGYALFSDQHRNKAGGSWTLPDGSSAPAAGPIGVAAFDQARVAMASQLDVSGNDILDIRPDTLLLPLKNEGSARVLIGSPYDPDATSKLQRPNMVQGLVRNIVGSGRLRTGAGNVGWYFFADKDIAPAVEVAFLNGVNEPFLDNELGWRIDGTEWKVRLDYGTAPVNWRSAFYNPGA